MKDILKDPLSLDGRVVLITGGAGAIGSAVGRLAAHHGANVVISDLNAEGAQQVAKAIEQESGRKALGVAADSTKEEDLQRLVKATLDEFGKITCLVNNVGWGGSTDPWGSDTEKMLRSYTLNTVGSYNLTKLCMPHLRKERNASVLFSGSLVGVTPSPEFIEYSTAKAALLNMARSLAVVSGPEVRINSLIIGSVDNGESTLKAGYDAEMLKRLADSFVLKRRGDPLDIAYGFLFLMSDMAEWVTGIELLINGGGIYKSKMPGKD
jgi:NAD(P)-dependent dehydrogenase (short-subunit alcohol dehydrogenase family)